MGEPRCDKLQTIQSEVRVDGLNELGLLTDERRLPTCANHSRVWTQFFFHASNDTVHQSNITIEQAALHAADSRGTDHACRFLNLDSRQFGGVLIERLSRNHNTGRDDATKVLTGRGD